MMRDGRTMQLASPSVVLLLHMTQFVYTARSRSGTIIPRSPSEACSSALDVDKALRGKRCIALGRHGADYETPYRSVISFHRKEAVHTSANRLRRGCPSFPSVAIDNHQLLDCSSPRIPPSEQSHATVIRMDKSPTNGK